MSKLVDSKGNVIFEGSQESCEDCLLLAYADPADVTESDEVMYSDFLYNAKWTGKLKII